MFNTFVMDKRVMLSYFRKNPKNVGGTDHLKDTIRFSRKLARLHDELRVSTEPDIWDIYVNPGGPNLSCILENFQPDRQVLGPECKFIGFPGEINGEYPTRDIIYVAMGTILNRNEEFYKLCIRALGQLDQHCVLVVGRSTNIASLGDVPGNIHVVPFADQVSTLKRSMVFLTRGGMASAHEALYAKTPMIVVPEMAEQQMNAETIESMGVGLHLPAPDVSEESILQSINHILKNHSTYTNNIRALIAAAPQRSPGEIAAESIISYIGN
jgi:MGT family glycosyltransferase